MEINFLKNKKGFSILEVLVAITIFSIGLIGVSSMMLQTMQVETLNSGYLKASMLAQEGIELVRGLRDENWLNPTIVPWDLGIAGADNTIEERTFVIDYDGNLLRSVNSINDIGASIYLDIDNFYQHFGIIPTSYKRLITIDRGSCVDECWNIRSEVQWTSSGKINSYIAETTLYDWR